MKVYISADIEGVTGVTHWDETDLSKAEYSIQREQMTAEVVADKTSHTKLGLWITFAAGFAEVELTSQAGSRRVPLDEFIVGANKTCIRPDELVTAIRWPVPPARSAAGFYKIGLRKADACSVINAGDGYHEHPTQALLDMYSLKERFGSLKGLEVAIVGDIKHSRVARSNVYGLTKMGARVTLVAPKTLLPPGVETWGAKISTISVSHCGRLPSFGFPAWESPWYWPTRNWI